MGRGGRPRQRHPGEEELERTRGEVDQRKARERSLLDADQEYAGRQMRFAEEHPDEPWNSESVFDDPAFREKFGGDVVDELRARIVKPVQKTEVSAAAAVPPRELTPTPSQVWEELAKASVEEARARGEGYERERKYSQAAAAYERAFRNQPKYEPEVFLKVITLLAFSRNFERAENLIDYIRGYIEKNTKRKAAWSPTRAAAGKAKWDEVFASAERIISRARGSKELQGLKPRVIVDGQMPKAWQQDEPGKEEFWIQRKDRGDGRRRGRGRGEELPNVYITARERLGKNEQEEEWEGLKEFEEGEYPLRIVYKDADTGEHKEVLLETEEDRVVLVNRQEYDARAMLAAVRDARDRLHVKKDSTIDVEVFNPTDGRVLSTLEVYVDREGNFGIPEAPPPPEEEMVNSILSSHGIDPADPMKAVHFKREQLVAAVKQLDGQIAGMSEVECKNFLTKGELDKEKLDAITEVMDDFPTWRIYELSMLLNELDRAETPLLDSSEKRKLWKGVFQLEEGIRGVLADINFWVAPARIENLVVARKRQIQKERRGRKEEEEKRKEVEAKFDETKEQEMREALRAFGVPDTTEVTEQALEEAIDYQKIQYDDDTKRLNSDVIRGGTRIECEKVRDEEIENLRAWFKALQQEVPLMIERVNKFKPGPDSPKERIETWREVLATLKAKIREHESDIAKRTRELQDAVAARLAEIGIDEERERIRKEQEQIVRLKEQAIQRKVTALIDEIEKKVGAKAILPATSRGRARKPIHYMLSEAIGRGEYNTLLTGVGNLKLPETKRKDIIEIEFEPLRRAIEHFAIRAGEARGMNEDVVRAQLVALTDEVARERTENPEQFRYRNLGTPNSKVLELRGLSLNQLTERLQIPPGTEDKVWAFLDYLEAARKFWNNEKPVGADKAQVVDETEMQGQVEALIKAAEEHLRKAEERLKGKDRIKDEAGFLLNDVIGNAEYRLLLERIGRARDDRERQGIIDTAFEPQRRLIEHFALKVGQGRRLSVETVRAHLAGLLAEVARERAENPAQFRYSHLGSPGSQAVVMRQWSPEQVLHKLQVPKGAEERVLGFLDMLEAARRFQNKEQPAEANAPPLDEALIAVELGAFKVDGSKAPEANAAAFQKELDRQRGRWNRVLQAYEDAAGRATTPAELDAAQAGLGFLVRKEGAAFAFGVEVLRKWEQDIRTAARAAATARWRPIVETLLPIAEQHAEEARAQYDAVRQRAEKNTLVFKREKAMGWLRDNAFFKNILAGLLERIKAEQGKVKTLLSAVTKPKSKDEARRKNNLQQEADGAQEALTMLANPTTRHEAFSRILAQVQGELSEAEAEFGRLNLDDETRQAAWRFVDHVKEEGEKNPRIPEELAEAGPIVLQINVLQREQRHLENLVDESRAELEKTPERKMVRYAENMEAFTLAWASDKKLWAEGEERTRAEAMVQKYLESHFKEKTWSNDRKAALRELIREVWSKLKFTFPAKLDPKHNHETNKWYIDFNPFGLDTKSSIRMLELAGIKMANDRVRPVLPGTRTPGIININVGGEEGTITPLMSYVEDARTAGQTPKFADYPKDKRTLFIDHHAKESVSKTSATQHLFETLAYLGCFDAQDEAAIRKAVELVTYEDNKSHPDWKGQTADWWREKSWRTLVGLAANLNFDRILSYAKDHPDTNFSEVLSDEDLERYNLKFSAEKARDNIPREEAVWQQLEEKGFLVYDGKNHQVLEGVTRAHRTWEQYEFFLVNGKHSTLGNAKIVLGLGGAIPGGINAVRALGGENVLYAIYNEEVGSFLVSSGGKELPTDMFGDKGFRLRSTMWVYRDEEGRRSAPPLRSFLERLGVSGDVLEGHAGLKAAVERQELRNTLFRNDRRIPIEVRVSGQTIEIYGGLWKDARTQIREALKAQMAEEPLRSELSRHITDRSKAEPAGIVPEEEAERFLDERAEQILLSRMREYRKEREGMERLRETCKKYFLDTELLRPADPVNGPPSILVADARDNGIRGLLFADKGYHGILGDRLYHLLRGNLGEWEQLTQGKKPVMLEPQSEALRALRDVTGDSIRQFVLQEANIRARSRKAENVQLAALFGPGWPDVKQLIG